MISHFISFLEALVLKFGSSGIFIASFIEEFFAPIPSGIVMLSAGYGLMGELPLTFANIWVLYVTAALPIAAGLTIGSLVWYLLTYTYGEIFIKKFGKYVFVKWSDVERVRHRFEKRHKSEFGLFIIRAIPILPSILINFAAGLMKVRFIPYVITTFLGTSIRASIIAFIGWRAGRVYVKYAHIIDHFEKAIFVIIIFIIFGYILYQKKKPKV